MLKRVTLRALTAEERDRIERLSRSRTMESRMTERIKIVRMAAQGCGTTEIARAVGLSRPRVLDWITRFNRNGMAGLADLSRSGRPPTYSIEAMSVVIATSLTPPQQLGLPFASWTLDRLEAYLNEVKGIAIKRSRIDEILIAEGLRWRQHETWFGERVDPQFAEKRGSSNGSTPSRRRTVW